MSNFSSPFSWDSSIYQTIVKQFMVGLIILSYNYWNVIGRLFKAQRLCNTPTLDKGYVEKVADSHTPPTAVAVWYLPIFQNAAGTGANEI